MKKLLRLVEAIPNRAEIKAMVVAELDARSSALTHKQTCTHTLTLIDTHTGRTNEYSKWARMVVTRFCRAWHSIFVALVTTIRG